MVCIDFNYFTHTRQKNMEHLLGRALLIIAVPFVLTTIYFGARKGGYYDTDMYKGNGTAH